MNIKIIKNSELDAETRNAIIKLKEQHWPYGNVSQIKWLENNLKPSDMHLCIFDEPLLSNEKYQTDLIAYMNLVEIIMQMDSKEIKCIGIGNVCVDKKYIGKGFGALLMENINDYLIRTGRTGILLCKELLTGFYKRTGWEFIKAKEAIFINHVLFKGFLMAYNCDETEDITNIYIDRNF